MLDSRELYLVKEVDGLEGVYDRKFVSMEAKVDKTFVEKVRDLGYKFLMVYRKIDLFDNFSYNQYCMEQAIYGSYEETIVDPEKILLGEVSLSDIWPDFYSDQDLDPSKF